MRSVPRPLTRAMICITLIAATLIAVTLVATADDRATLEIDAGKPGTQIPPDFFGLMTEEINHSYDGGLYAELIQNRTFQDPTRNPAALPVHWFVVGSGKASTDTTNPVNAALPISLKLELTGGECGIANDGYWGIPVRPSTTYTASFYARSGGQFSGPVAASIRLDEGGWAPGGIVARAETQSITNRWRKYTITLKTGIDAPTLAKARFVLSGRGTGRIWFSNVSLFPPTYRNAPNGLRPDLMQLMAALRPKFIRLPGGNYVEGSRFADRFNWKQMIGPVDRRPGHQGCWGYRSSDGFGIPEYLLWCRQLGAEPVLAVFAGYVLNGDHVRAGSPEMAVYMQEALDEIEYISGPAASPWGKRRAADGFREPFRLRYVEIGNEDWFDRSGSYDGRFAQMAKAIRKRYPNLKIIATAPVKSFKPDLYDDHFYRSPRQLFQMATMYDKPAPPILTFNGGGHSGRQPAGIRTFVGEWAAQEGRPTPNLNSALADAAFVMGLEKNSDAVPMECYAPLLVNVSPADPDKGYPRGWQWNTNLIGYDALRSFGSASYYAQVMLAQNKGDAVLPARLAVAQPAPVENSLPAAKGAFGLGSWHTRNEYADIRVTAPDGSPLVAEPGELSWKSTGGEWRVRSGAIGPATPDSETWAIAGDPGWTDYTIHARARKLGGSEGFILLFHAKDGENYHWWNIGGWNNTLARCEAAEGGSRTPYGTGSPFSVETGRWYDLRLDVTGQRVRGFVDGKLVTDTTYQQAAAVPRSIFATATYQKSPGMVLVKVVNMGDSPVDMAINLKGVGRIEPVATAVVLSGEPGWDNTIDEPRKVLPRQDTVSGASTSFRRAFPAHSFTILRLRAAR